MRVANISGGRTSMYMGLLLHRTGFDGIYCFQKSEAEPALTLKWYPELYSQMENLEKEIGGTLRQTSLEQFRIDVENDISFDFNMENENYCTHELGGCGD